ncbi:MAG: hypothetical protein IPG04_00615 [Polyangiaceae bacterium]|nr:hypothetical protein [Polyangiaceae bacterium]
MDTVTVGGLLRDRQLLASIGGAAYLAQIVDATPSVRNVGAHAERVANLARDRRVLAAAHRIVADGYDPTESYAADAVRALRHAADETRPAEPTQPRPPDLAALCASMPGRFLRVPTGIHGLDLAMRGGLRTANLAVVGGAPGGHKTSIVGAMAYRWARDGVPHPIGPPARARVDHGKRRIARRVPVEVRADRADRARRPRQRGPRCQSSSVGRGSRARRCSRWAPHAVGPPRRSDHGRAGRGHARGGPAADGAARSDRR